MTCGCGLIAITQTPTVVLPTTKTLQILTIAANRVGQTTNGYPMAVFTNAGVFLSYANNANEYATIWNAGNLTLPNITFNGTSFTTTASSSVTSLQGDYIFLNEDLTAMLDEQNNYIYYEENAPI